MNPFELMTINEKDFTKSDLIIKEAILANPDTIMRHNIISASANMNVSKSALLRFCKKLGYSGFSDFKYDLSRYIISGGLNQEPHDFDTVHVLATMRKAIEQMENTIQKSDLEELSVLIRQANNIRIFGIQSSGTAATQLMYRMSKVGILAQAITDLYLYEELRNYAKSDDLHIYFSLSATGFDGPIDFETKAKAILITQNSRSELCKKFDKVIVLPTLENNLKDFFIECHFLTFAFIELLIIQLSKDVSTPKK